MKGWLGSFFDENGYLKRESRSGVSPLSYRDGELSFDVKTKSGRTVFVQFYASQNGALFLKRVSGKKMYSPEDVVSIAKKCAEIYRDHDDWYVKNGIEPEEESTYFAYEGSLWGA